MSDAKRIAINHKNIAINVKKIKSIEAKINNIQRPRPRLIGSDGKDLTNKIDNLESQFKKSLDNNHQQKDLFISSILDRLDNLENENKKLTEDNQELRKHINNQIKTSNSNLIKFKSEILPVINKHIAHRGIREARRNRR